MFISDEHDTNFNHHRYSCDDYILGTMYEINENREAPEVIARLDERMNLEQTDMDGKRMTIIHKGYASRHLFEIENFVKDIVHSEGQHILGKKYYRQVNNWLDYYSEIYRYSTRVEAFYDACKSMGLIGSKRSFEFSLFDAMEISAGISYMDLFNKLIEQVYACCQGREFKERERLRKANAERNKKNVLALEEAMFSEETGRSRWIILSLTLRYKPSYRRWITPDIIQQHRDRFFAARRFNELMSGIKNYVWTIEQGEDTGLHLHVILFYSADSNHDEYIAMQIGKYWENIVTEGKGDYWNSNGGKLKKGYAEKGHGVGVGQINWNDLAKRDALRINLVYLAKTEQYLMIKVANSIHTFGTGQVPKKAKSGRPRGLANCETIIA
ncbi:conserved hypothetical protein [Herminiimonas arsenicoxydans]|uniref:Inovirus Gp2 family protein n=1 Tax=Herminiimonas arsenicoxydans TaxID=204773 RepID=A4G2F0_HERAR|nr:conserved hypothetical protein [Herminiimonas arsenicoxydans]